MNKPRHLLTLFAGCIGTLLIMVCVSAWSASSTQAPRFELALPGYTYHFPRDHYSHPTYKTEWWYFTGNITDAQQRPFGYELTFFRANPGLAPCASNSSPWCVDNVYMTHFALSDIQRPSFGHLSKQNRGAFATAGALPVTQAAQTKLTNWTPLVWNQAWRMAMKGNAFHLKAQAPQQSLDLTLTPEKPPVIHGKNGVSQKAACKGCASHYYSLTRLKTTGTIISHGKTYRVKGYSWMDHEFGSNQLTAQQVGWDWFSVQLSDGSDLMLYRMRLANGKTDPQSSGTWVSSKGTTTHLTVNDFVITSDRTWTSPHSKGRYPAQWHINVPKQHLDLVLTPKLADQELSDPKKPDLSYWEGATAVTGRANGKPITGHAYVELTGYAQRFRQRL